MALIIPLGPQVKIGVRIGYAKAPNAKMVVMSLTNGAASVDCNGINYPVTWVATDSDGGAASPAGYVGEITLGGLAEFTQYGYTVTQGVSTVTGSFSTLPGPNDDFCFYAITCDAAVAASANGGVTDGEGMYKTFHEQINAGGLPCVGILHVDDHGYVAARKFSDPAAVGLDTQTPAQLNTEYAFSAGWLNYYGLHANGSGDSGFGDSAAYTTTGNIDIGRTPHRVWCMQNLPVWPQWGDWEFKNDIGMDFPTTNPGVPNPFHKTYTGSVGNRDGGGLLAWNRFMKPLQPPSIASADANANHWAFDLGCIRLIAVDGITNSNGAVTSYAATNFPDGILYDDTIGVTQVSAMLGSNQIADILAAIDPYAQFTILGLMHGVRYMGKFTSEWYTGTQHPIKNHCPAEFAQLFTASGSLADKPETNNSRGVLFTFNGDYHNGHIYHHQITDGTLPTDFYEVGLGTVTTSYNHAADSVDPRIGEAFKGSTVEYLDYDVAQLTNEFHRSWGVKVSVYGSKPLKQVVIELLAVDGTPLWSAKFIGQIGNAKLPVNYEPIVVMAP